jgi:hypothetical protein
MAIEKICEHCEEAFQCGGPACWCRHVPLTQPQRDGIAVQFQDCLCPGCLPQLAEGGLQATMDIHSYESGGRNQPEGGVCPSHAILLRQTICKHLRRSRPETILNVFQRIRLRLFRACGLASASISFPSQRRITRTDS